MKLLIYIFLISLSYVLSDFVDDVAKKIVVKRFPKKVKPGLFRINNSGKYVKPKTTAFSQEAKKPGTDELYTVFPKVHQFVGNPPDSPFFQAEKNIDPALSRFKKALPSRAKRSVAKKDDGSKKVMRQPEKAMVKPPVSKPVLRGNATQNERLKPNHPRQKVNKNMKRKRRLGKRLGNRLRLGKGRLRNGPIKNRKLKYTRPQNRNRNNARLRSRLGGKQVQQKKVLADKKSVMNATKPKKAIERRLIAARDTMIEDYPYVVSIQKEREHWCAGALLNPRLVITTANCLWKGNRVSRMHIRAGSRHTDRGGQVANIQEMMKHPGWKIRKNPDNDVGLILLDRKIKFGHGVHGVDLPNRIMMPAFEDAWITSWGSERRDGVFETKSDTLQVYHARVMDRQKCNNITQRFGVKVTDNFICLAQTGRRAPCTRDTGAPAVSDGVLWGMASWGIRKLCGTERFPAMFSYLGSQSNLDFIINATHYLMADERFEPYLDRMPRMRGQTTHAVVPTLPF